MKAYSVDLRQRILAAIDRGMPRQQVVVTFGVSLATLKRLLARRRDTGDLTPQSPPGRRRSIPAEHHAALWAQLQAHPDATLETHTQLWNAAQGTAVSRWTLGRAIQRLGWTRKKRLWLPPSAANSSASTTGSASRSMRRMRS
jgi:transposase